MIEQITIHNFQSHKHSELQFSPGVNVIVGRSGSGKTAILRAINWVVNNKPSGTAFQSHFRDRKDATTSVTFHLDDTTVERRRNGTENNYVLDGEEELKAGTAVPQAVEKLINIGEINFQRQMDKHFLLSESPAEIGRILNRIVRLDLIDVSTSNINKKLLSTKEQIRNIQGSIFQKENELESYEGLDFRLGRVNNALQIEDELTRLRKTYAELAHIIDTIGSVNTALKVSTKKTKHKEKVNEALALLTEQEALRSKVAKLHQITSTLRSVIAEKKKYTKKPKVKQIIDTGLSIVSEIDGIHFVIKKLESDVTVLDNIEESIKVTKRQIIRKNKEWDQTMPEHCPLCGAEKEYHKY